ncbi:hypothetical protein ACXX9E_29595 [Pseudomonas sp. GNP014]
MELFWQITDGYHLYQKRLKFDGLRRNKPALPEGEFDTTSFSASSRVSPRPSQSGYAQWADQGPA